MNLTKRNLINETKRTLGIIVSLFSLLIIGCEDNPEYYDDIEFEYVLALQQDANGYYRMPLGSNWQTTQRLTGTLTSNHSESRADYLRDLVETIMVYWESSHYWVLNDTLGYIINQGLTDDLVYVAYDTSYITGFSGFEVKTINFQSYPIKDGETTYEVNQMFAPVQSMRGDTIQIWTYFWDLNNNYKEYTTKIIIE